MKEISLSVSEYNQIVEATGLAVSADNFRRDLRFIRITVTKNELQAFSVDGYQYSRIFIRRPFGEEFTCHIRPIKSGLPDSVNAKVYIRKSEGSITELEIPTEFGKVVHAFNYDDDTFSREIDPDQIKGTDDIRPHWVAVDANRMIKAFKSIKKFGRGYCKLRISDDPKTPVLIETLGTKKGEVHIEQLVLPVRALEED